MRVSELERKREREGERKSKLERIINLKMVEWR